MMKYLPLIPLLFVAPLHAEVTKTHQEFSLDLLELLSEIELCLAQCQDAESVAQNMEQLQVLSDQMAALAQLQKEMLDPTIADYIAAEKHVAEFNMLWSAIKNHIERLKEENLYSASLQEILKF